MNTSNNQGASRPDGGCAITIRALRALMAVALRATEMLGILICIIKNISIS